MTWSRTSRDSPNHQPDKHNTYLLNILPDAGSPVHDDLLVVVLVLQVQGGHGVDVGYLVEPGGVGLPEAEPADPGVGVGLLLGRRELGCRPSYGGGVRREGLRVRVPVPVEVDAGQAPRRHGVPREGVGRQGALLETEGHGDAFGQGVRGLLVVAEVLLVIVGALERVNVPSRRCSQQQSV